MMKPSPDEDQDLAELDGLLRVEVARGLQDDEERVVVRLELGPLVGLDGVLDGELVELELAPHRLELLFGRLEEPDPPEGAVSAAGFVGSSSASSPPRRSPSS